MYVWPWERRGVLGGVWGVGEKEKDKEKKEEKKKKKKREKKRKNKRQPPTIISAVLSHHESADR